MVEIARLLDLELVLAPRASILAIEALIREAETRSGRLGGQGPAQTPAYSLDDDDPANE